MIKVRVYHTLYGCETGCCGHIVELTMPDGKELQEFDFDHPYGVNAAAWARAFAEEKIRECFPKCIDSIDWSTLDVDVQED